MCERFGNTHTNLLSMSRRGFLKGTGASAVSVALPAGLAGMLGATSAQAATTLKATHGAGLCNMGIFLAKKRNLAQADGVELDFVVTPTTTDVVTLFGSGQVDISVIPYSNFLTLVDAGAPVRMVAGAGVEGCILVGGPGIKTAADLKGKTIGTFQADTLEVLPYDYLKKAGLSFKDVKVRYFNTSPELATAFINGGIDAVCHIEPYATQCQTSRAGQAETDPAAALRDTVGTYYKTSMEAATAAQSKQPIMIDQRQNTKFFSDRSQSMMEMGYVKKLMPAGALDWKLIEQVIGENRALYDGLKLKAA